MKKLFGLLVVIFTAMILGGAPQASSAETTASIYDSKYDAAEIVVQDVLARYSVCTPDSGISQVFYKAVDRTFYVYWRGEIPESLIPTLKELPADITVSLNEAKYSWCDLQATSTSLEHMSNPSIVFAAYPAEDGDALNVEVNGELSTQEQTDLQNNLNKVPGTVADIKVRATSNYTALSNRQTDTSPWVGGSGYGWFSGSDFNYCSTAAGVWSDANNAPYVLTAAHCVEPGKGAVLKMYTGDQNTYFGTTDTGNSGYVKSAADVALIKGSPSSVSDLMYHGGYLASSTLSLYGPGRVSLYQSICLNGANSGKHCNAEVTKIFTTSIHYASFDRTNMVEASSTDQNWIAVGGDSGGPVFNYVSATGRYMLDGVLSAGDNTAYTPCGSIYFDRYSPPCYTRVLFEDINAALSAIHVHMAH